MCLFCLPYSASEPCARQLCCTVTHAQSGLFGLVCKCDASCATCVPGINHTAGRPHRADTMEGAKPASIGGAAGACGGGGGGGGDAELYVDGALLFKPAGDEVHMLAGDEVQWDPAHLLGRGAFSVVVRTLCAHVAVCAAPGRDS